MKRFLSVILAIVILFTSVPSIPLNAVSAQEVPNDPNQAYPIDGPGSGPEEDETLPEDPINPTYNPNDAYPVDNGDDPESGTPFDIPAEYVEFPELLPGQSPETEAQLPLPEMEMVEIYQPPVLEAESKPPRISVSVEPQIYVENTPIEISWEVKTSRFDGANSKSLRLYLPDDLRPSDPLINNEVNHDGILEMPAENAKSTLSLSYSGEFEDKESLLSLSLELLEGDVVLDHKDIQIPAYGYTLEDIQRENLRINFPNEVDISTVDLPIEKNLIFHIGSPKAQTTPSYSLSGMPFEILAVNPATAKNVTQFNKALEITLVYDDDQYDEETEKMLQVFYYDQEQNDWFPYETAVDIVNNVLTIQSDHLTVFDIGAIGAQAYLPPSIQDFEVSGFTGAATYSYPIQTFEGAGGLKPELNLTYNSQIVDQGVAYTQASWVGMGWNLDTGYITRDMHGTDYSGEGNNSYPSQNDDTFFVNLSGISGRLLPVSKNGARFEYVLQNNPSERFFYERNQESWEMRTGDGLVYIFGIIRDGNGNPMPEKVALARYQPGAGCHKFPEQVWKWGLLEIRDSFGNKIEYKYNLEKKGDYEDRICNNHIDIYPTEIRYGTYTIKFNVEQRGDYKASWEGKHSGVQYSKVRLVSIDLSVSGQRVKSYLFNYWNNEAANQTIMPGLIWQGNNRTLTLESIQEVSNRETNSTQGYKPTTFYYRSEDPEYEYNNLHLVKVDNGYGGEVSFEYTPFIKPVNTVNPYIKKYPLIQDRCYGKECADNAHGWDTTKPSEFYRRDTGYHDGKSWSALKLYNNNPSEPATMWAEIPEMLMKPGYSYQLVHEVSLQTGHTEAWSRFGIRTISGQNGDNPIFVEQQNLLKNQWVRDAKDLYIPTDYPLLQSQLYVQVKDTSMIGNILIRPYITRYAVIKKTVTDTTTPNSSASWTYHYPETFKMNDNTGAGWYLPEKSEFWGFPEVIITQTDGVTQKTQVITQHYHTDRDKKGLLDYQTVGTGENCYSSSHYTYTTKELYLPGQLANTNLRGYQDLKVIWNQNTSVEEYSYDGALCLEINQSSTEKIGTKQLYEYNQVSAPSANRNLRPIKITNQSFDGNNWQTITKQTTKFVEPITYEKIYDGKSYTFEFNYLVESQKLEDDSNLLLHESRFAYNESNLTLANQRELIEQVGNTQKYALTTYSWTSRGNLASKTSWQNSTNNPDAPPSGLFLTTTYSYDNSTFPSLVTSEKLEGSDDLELTTHTEYNQLGLPVKIIHPDNSTESARYDSLGRIIAICGRGFSCGSSNYTATVIYNMEANPPSVTIKRQDTASIRYSYTGFGQVKDKVILGAEIKGQIQNFTEQSFIYDGLGNVFTESYAGLSRKTEIDGLGRVIRIARVTGVSEETEVSYTYNLLSPENNGKLLWEKSTRDAKGNVSKEYSNSLGQLVRIVPPIGPESSFEYDSLGRLIKTTYGTAETEISYNAAGQKIWMNDADMGVWRYSYDTWGNLLSQTDARGKVITMSYNSFSRLKAKTTTEGIVSYSYDEAGRRTGMVDQSGETEWTYDKRGRLIQEEKTVLGNQYRTVWVYNNADQVTQMIYPSKEKVKYTYLPQGNLRGVGNYQWDLKTDEHNRVKEKSLFDGNKITYSYYGWLENSGGTLKNITAFKGSNNILELRYQYDELGNVSQIKDRGNAFQTQHFEYDRLNRLVSAETDYLGEGHYNQSYSYEPDTGNLKNHSELGDYTYNELHPHAVETAGGYSYTYDENGNATSRTVNGQTESYMYDSENRLIEIKSQDESLKKFLYDGDGNRVARLDANNEGTIFIGNYFESEYPWIEDEKPPIGVVPGNPGDTSLCEAETENCAYLPVLAREASLKPFPVKRGTSYYYADGQRIAMRIGSEAYLLFGDHLGSSSVVINANGEVVEKAYYLPWGGARGEETITSTDYGYTGQMREDDIYYYGARYYDPAIGRFMQADTIVPLQVQGTQAFDRYAYVNNNPLRYTDPTGHSSSSDFLSGLAIEFVNNMTYGMVDALVTQQSDSKYFNYGQEVGIWLARAVNIAEIVIGSGLVGGSFSLIAGTGGLGFAAALPSGGGSIAVAVPVIAVEAIPLVGGIALAAHGASSLIYSMSRKDMTGPIMNDDGFLGKNGTQTRNSETLWKNSEGRLDIENINPGQRLGNLHFQTKEGYKFRYNAYTGSFLPDLKNNVPVPKFLKNLLRDNEGFRRSIMQGLKIFGGENIR